MELDQKTIDTCGRARTRDDVISVVIAERARCIHIINLARSGEIDSDLRSIISRIKYPQD